MVTNTYMINEVECDAYAYTDDNRSCETVVWPSEGRGSYFLRVYLFADGKPFPVELSTAVDAECYITEDRNVPTPEVSELTCLIGSKGEIRVGVASRYRIPGKVYYCEINVVGNKGREDEYRFKASNFRLAFIE